MSAPKPKSTPTPMSGRALKALKASIRKWERNVAAVGPADVKLGAFSCPLCKLYNPDEWVISRSCHSCPVYAKTKRLYCDGTPYKKAAKAKYDWHYQTTNEKAAKAFRRAAQAEVNFLRGLLPAGEEV